MAIQIEFYKRPPIYFSGGSPDYFYDNVIGHVLVMVVKQDDGSVTLERDIAVNADSFEDNQLAEATVKEIEGKFNEFLPKPEFVVYDEKPKIWIPE